MATGPSGTHIVTKSRYPTSEGSVSLSFDYTASAGRGPERDTRVIGLTSRATGVCAGYITDPDRMFIDFIVNGPGGGFGTPFLPGEIIEKIGDAGKTVTLNTILKQTESQTPISGKTKDDDIGP